MFNWFIDWKLQRSAIAREKKRNAMIEVITAHGMKAHKYFPGIGYRDNVELSSALDWCAGHGFIVTDKTGGIVGKVATANMDSGELAEIRRSQFKLV